MSDHRRFMREAIDLALANVREKGGRPFGAVVVRDGAVIATGVNEMVASGDPTAHAEMQAIRAAARALGSVRLDGCVVYASGHPCPMCLAAMHMSGVTKTFFACSQEDAEPYGLSTGRIYEQMRKPPAEQTLAAEHLPVLSENEEGPFALWSRLANRPAGA